MIATTRKIADLGEGAALLGHYKGKPYKAKIVRTRSGELAVRLKNKNYPSMSAAGVAVIGTECNGWMFWSLAEPGEGTKRAVLKEAGLKPVKAVA